MKRRVSKRTNATTALLQHILDKECCSHVRVYLMRKNVMPFEVSKEAHTLRFTISDETLRHIPSEGITELLRMMQRVVDDYNRSWTETDPSDMQRDIEIYSQDEQDMEVMVGDEPDDI